MTADDEVHLEVRIRERAFQIWLDEGKPEGREKGHWEMRSLPSRTKTACGALSSNPIFLCPNPLKLCKIRYRFLSKP